MSHSTFNRRWAGVILEALTRHGVRHICIAPGSRSAPLTLEAAAHATLICHTHFDERGLGHLALGLAKALRQPVAVIVTSGTAAANLYPAIIEARLTGERLVILTADRPPELIDCGANQAIEQPGLFAGQVAAACNLPRPTPDIPARWLVSAVDALLGEHRWGALHLNCPFAEPLYGGDPDAFSDWHDALGDWWHSDQPWLSMPARSAIPVQPEWPTLRQKRGVAIAGKITPEEGIALAAWASALGWPLLADVQSQCGQPLASAEVWLRQPATRDILSATEVVVQFGSHLTSKQLSRWLGDTQPDAFWLIESMPGRRDPVHHRGVRIVADILPWLATHPAVTPASELTGNSALMPNLRQDADSSLEPDPRHDTDPLTSQRPWYSRLNARVAQTREILHRALDHFGEAQLAHRLPALLPEKGSLFLGNSLTIRLADALAQLPAGYPVFANRGASGIDGPIATAAGIQRGSGQPLLAVVGDLSALYDINSLALLRQGSAPLVLIVVNNNGGQIFSMLPTPKAERERFFALPQQVNFSGAAALFGLAYHQPRSWEALLAAVDKGWQNGAALIELRVEEQAAAQFLAEAGKDAQ